MALGDDQLKNVEAIRLGAESANEALRGANKEAKNIADAFGNIKDELGKISTVAGRFAGIQEEIKKSSNGTVKALEEQKKAQNISATLNARLNVLLSSGTAIDRRRAKILKTQADNAEAVADAFGDIAKESSEIDKKTKFFDGVSNIVQDIPGLRKLSGPFEAAALAARETAGSVNALGKKAGPAKIAFKGIGAGLSSAASSLGKGGAAGGIVFLIQKFVELSFKADAQVTKLGKSLSLSKEAARGLRNNLTSSRGNIESIYKDTQSLVDAMTQLAELSEFTSIASIEQVDAQLQLTKQLGLSVEEANELQGLFKVNTEGAIEGKKAIFDQVAAFANQTGLLADSSKIMKQITNASKLTRLNFKGSTAELAKTVLNANRLGLSLSQVENIGGSLLDFESSIAAEMEAELITGRELNLEKARTFALNNDIAGLTQEIAKQGITAEKFSGMNRIAQEAIAKSLGMQASELADSLYKAKLIRETGGGYTDELRRQADQQERNNNLQEAEDLRRRASLIDQGLLSGQNLEDAKLAVSAQDKFNQLLLRVQNIFSDLIDGGTVDRFVEYIERVVKFFEGGGTILGLMRGKVPSRSDYEAQGETFSSPINAEDFTIKTHPKDTLVMAGGTKLGGGSNSNDEVVSLLRELVNRNGDVYLDGQKVGNALSSNYRTMSN